MKISMSGIGEKQRHFTLALPSPVVFNRVTACLAVKFGIMKNEAGEPKLSYDQVCALMTALRKGKSCLHGLPLLDVESSDGEKIKIYL